MSRTIKAIASLDAETCFRRFCQGDRLAEWVPGVELSEVLRLDPHGLPAEVRFRSAGGVKSYTLLYAYDLPQRRVAWMPGEGASHAVRGFIAFAEAPVAEGEGKGRCEVSYALDAGISRRSDAAVVLAHAQATLDAFVAWVEATP
jgi:hypothetical protein